MGLFAKNTAKAPKLYSEEGAQVNNIAKHLTKNSALINEYSVYYLPVLAGFICITLYYVFGAVVVAVSKNFPGINPLKLTATQWMWDILTSFFIVHIYGSFALPLGFIVFFAVVVGVYIYVRTKFGKMRNTGLLEAKSMVAFSPERHRKNLTIPEIAHTFKPFPDEGAISKTVVPTVWLSHIYLKPTNKLQKVDSVKVIATKSVKGIKTDWITKLETDSHGNLVHRKLPIIDKTMAEVNAARTAGLPPVYTSMQARKDVDDMLQDPSKLIVYGHTTLEEFIKKDWEMPEGEVARPQGVYFVDEDPQNVYVVGITRSGKGATRVENTVDMWSREKNPNNAVINDPKGEIAAHLAQHISKLGINVQILNLEASSQSIRYNPLLDAIQMLRQDRRDEFIDAVDRIVETFFPENGKTEAIWIKGPQIFFRELLYLLMSISLDEEQYIRYRDSDRKDQAEIDDEIDRIWAKNVLASIPRMVTEWTTEKVPNPYPDWVPPVSSAAPKSKGDDDSDDDDESDQVMVSKLDVLLEQQRRMPKTFLREALKTQQASMANLAPSDKTLASIMGIAVTTLVSFSEATFAKVTTASPRESLDISTLSHPRQFRFRFNPTFANYNSLYGMKVRITSYYDDEYKHPYESKDNRGEVTIAPTGWFRWAMKGTYKNQVTYLKLELEDPRSTDIILRTYYVQFTWGYLHQTGSKQFVVNNRTKGLVIKDGTLRIGQLDKETGHWINKAPMENVAYGLKTLAIDRSEARYAIRPIFLFMVAGPQTGSRIRIALLLIFSIYRNNLENSTQLGERVSLTRFMLDEAGNLTYGGAGIPAIEEIFSLGQSSGNQFTLILQTMQQLSKVYGKDLNSIMDANTATIVYIKSNEQSMLKQLSDRLGVAPRAEFSSRSNRLKDLNSMAKVDDDVSVNSNVAEKQLFSPATLQNFTKNESVIISLNTTDNDGNHVRPENIHNHKATFDPRWYELHQFGFGRLSVPNVDDVPRDQRTLSAQEVAEMVPDFNEIYERQSSLAIKAYLDQAIRTFNKRHHFPIDSDPFKSDLDGTMVSEELEVELNRIYDAVMHHRHKLMMAARAEAPKEQPEQKSTEQLKSIEEVDKEAQTQQQQAMENSVKKPNDDSKTESAKGGKKPTKEDLETIHKQESEILSNDNDTLMDPSSYMNDDEDETDEDVDEDEVLDDQSNMSELVEASEKVDASAKAAVKDEETDSVIKEKVNAIKTDQSEKKYLNKQVSLEELMNGAYVRESIEKTLKRFPVSKTLIGSGYHLSVDEEHQAEICVPNKEDDDETPELVLAKRYKYSDNNEDTLENEWQITDDGWKYLIDNPDRWTLVRNVDFENTVYRNYRNRLQ